MRRAATSLLLSLGVVYSCWALDVKLTSGRILTDATVDGLDATGRVRISYVVKSASSSAPGIGYFSQDEVSEQSVTAIKADLGGSVSNWVKTYSPALPQKSPEDRPSKKLNPGPESSIQNDDSRATNQVATSRVQFNSTERDYRLARARSKANTLDGIKREARAKEIVHVLESLTGQLASGISNREEFAKLVAQGRQEDKTAARQTEPWFQYRRWASLCDKVEDLVVNEIVHGGSKVTSGVVHKLYYEGLREWDKKR